MYIDEISNSIHVIDNFLTQQEEKYINIQLKDSAWRYNWPDLEGVAFIKPCWHIYCRKSRPEQRSCLNELNSSEPWRFLGETWERLSTLHNYETTLLGIYANGQTFGQDTSIHRDNKANPGLTMIVFCNEHWPTSWGGELVFYDDSKENIIKSVLPKSRRVVVFDGRIPHAARSPSLTCDQVRMTLAFKTIYKE